MDQNGSLAFGCHPLCRTHRVRRFAACGLDLEGVGIGNFGLRLFHSQDVSLMVLVWQVGAVCVLAAMAALAGRYVLNWRSIISTKDRSVLLHPS